MTETRADLAIFLLGYQNAAILLVALCIFWGVGLGAGMFSLLALVSFAIVGKGNRLLWVLIFRP